MVSRRIVLRLTGVCILHKSEGIDVEVGVVILVLLQERCNDQCRTTSLVICKHSRALYKTTYKQGAIQTILKAFTTNWDCRYGFYLDDGRIYIYRSGFLLCRFRLNIGEPIADFQIAADTQQNAAIIAFENAMESVEHRWYLIADSGEERPANLKYCKYYHGETECPKQIQNTIAAKFWHGEMMFIVNKLDVNHWKQIAMHTKENLNEDQLQFISKYSEEQFAIILYIEELYLENLKSVDPLLYSKLTHQ